MGLMRFGHAFFSALRLNVILRLCSSNVFLRRVKIIITRPFGEQPLGLRPREIVNRFPKEPVSTGSLFKGDQDFPPEPRHCSNARRSYTSTMLFMGREKRNKDEFEYPAEPTDLETVLKLFLSSYLMASSAFLLLKIEFGRGAPMRCPVNSFTVEKVWDMADTGCHLT